MKIKEVIRKLRKEQNLTQEQVANYLGVTAPAVNKWENGISYPDITLLAPLAKILNTNIDTLLSFHDELTTEEINKISEDVFKDIKNKGYEKAFENIANLINEYPNCDKLVLWTALGLNSYLAKVAIEDREKYRKQITAWLEVIARSEDEKSANQANSLLFRISMVNGNYDEAQQRLDQTLFACEKFEKMELQAELYSRQRRYDEARKIYEKILFENSMSIAHNLLEIIRLLCEQKDYEGALEYAKVARIINETFNPTAESIYSPELTVAVAMQDKDKCLLLLKKIATSINEVDSIELKPYQHMVCKKGYRVKMMKKFFKTSMDDSELDFLRNEPEFLRIYRMLAE